MYYKTTHHTSWLMGRQKITICCLHLQFECIIRSWNDGMFTELWEMGNIFILLAKIKRVSHIDRPLQVSYPEESSSGYESPSTFLVISRSNWMKASLCIWFEWWSSCLEKGKGGIYWLIEINFNCFVYCRLVIKCTVPKQIGIGFSRS